jgi:hypothetical protein
LFIYKEQSHATTFIISISPFSAQHVSASHDHPQVLLSENFDIAYVVIKFKVHVVYTINPLMTEFLLT